MTVAAWLLLLVGIPYLWRRRLTTPPTPRRARRVLLLSILASWLLLAIADVPALHPSGLAQNLLDACVLGAPLHLIFLFSAPLALSADRWRHQFLGWAAISAVLGIPLGLLGAIVIGCIYLGRPCL